MFRARAKGRASGQFQKFQLCRKSRISHPILIGRVLAYYGVVTMHTIHLFSPLALFLLLTVVGCTGTIPWKGDSPFPEGLLRQLELQGGDRAEVNELLGSPNATRRSGKLAIYIEPRQLEAYLGGVAQVENHHLLIEYDERERALQHLVLVNSECTPSGECLSNTRCTRGRYCPPGKVSAPTD
jgi:hypothetical protein